jgi:hypothetical protein
VETFTERTVPHAEDPVKSSTTVLLVVGSDEVHFLGVSRRLLNKKRCRKAIVRKERSMKMYDKMLELWFASQAMILSRKEPGSELETEVAAEASSDIVTPADEAAKKENKT